MRWPWVPRSTLDLTQQAASMAATLAALRITTLESELRTERDRYERLVGEMRELQRQGFTPPPPQPEAPERRGLPPEILTAIEAHMDLGGTAARSTARLAKEWLTAGEPVADIVKKIHEGVQ